MLLFWGRQAALSRFRKHQHRASSSLTSPIVSPGSARKRAIGNWDAPPLASPSWAKKVVRVHQPEVQPLATSPRVFHGGLGEPRAPRSPAAPPVGGGEGAVLDKEHRYWWISRFVASSHKCTLLPLVAAGRFGGCGRRAGRLRWRVAPEKRGFEREVSASLLQVGHASLPAMSMPSAHADRLPEPFAPRLRPRLRRICVAVADLSLCCPCCSLCRPSP